MSRTVLIIFFLLSGLGYAQVSQPDIQPQNGNGRDDNRPEIDNTKVNVEGEKPPVTDYLIISQDRDTTYLDTTLAMYKDYKFNFLRGDDFELMPFHNVGRPYNRLGREIEMERLSPALGATARAIAYLDVDDVYDYYVPTPLSDLYFKTAINQGQQLGALFTTNLSPQFNFSISYKGVRSAGNYVNTLTSTGIFKFTSNYFTKDKRYRLRLHTTFQSLENQENGGISQASLEGFLSEEEDFNDRGRLDPNLENADSDYSGKRFYIDHDYVLIDQRDSLTYQSLRVYNKMFYEDKFYRFEQDRINAGFLGPAVDTEVRDKTNLEEGAIELGAVYDHYLLGFFKAGVARQKFNYGYDRVIRRADGTTIPDRLIGVLYQFKGEFAKRLGDFDFKARGGLNFAGDLDGQYLNAEASYLWKENLLSAGLSINSRAPDFNYTLFQSDYSNYQWFPPISPVTENVNTQELFFRMDSEKLFDLQVSLTTIQNFTYFNESLITDSDEVVTGYNARPMQASGDIVYLKVKASRDLRFLEKFGVNNTLMYQSVDQPDNILNVPDLTVRTSLYYTDRWFENDAAHVQTGLTVKYFTAYFMDGYDPVLGEFYTQERESFGDFPMLDVFFNAKVRQTRIFFKFEHLNQIFSDPNFFSAPRHPYRDFSFRFGVVWNFFL
jgi:hypothetical protein